MVFEKLSSKREIRKCCSDKYKSKTLLSSSLLFGGGSTWGSETLDRIQGTNCLLMDYTTTIQTTVTGYGFFKVKNCCSTGIV